MPGALIQGARPVFFLGQGGQVLSFKLFRPPGATRRFNVSVINISCCKFVTHPDREVLKAGLTVRYLGLGLKSPPARPGGC